MAKQALRFEAEINNLCSVEETFTDKDGKIINYFENTCLILTLSKKPVVVSSGKVALKPGVQKVTLEITGKPDGSVKLTVRTAVKQGGKVA